MGQPLGRNIEVISHTLPLYLHSPLPYTVIAHLPNRTFNCPLVLRSPKYDKEALYATTSISLRCERLRGGQS
jgi:hypothetical protein